MFRSPFCSMNSAPSSSSSKDASCGLDAELPERVEECLKGCDTFGKFKTERKFRFLHLFAGPRDVLANALKEECDREGIQLEVESYDKLMDSKHDLLAEQPFTDILQKAKAGAYDGGHAGFPCGSFSRARYNTDLNLSGLELRYMAWQQIARINSRKQTGAP